MDPNRRRILRRVGIALMALLVVAAAGALAAWSYFATDAEAEAENLVRVLALEPGMTVAEIGAGGGEMAVHMAGRLGSSGRMYATEMGDSNREKLREAVEGAGLSNVTVLAAAERSTSEVVRASRCPGCSWSVPKASCSDPTAASVMCHSITICSKYETAMKFMQWMNMAVPSAHAMRR